MKMIKTAIAAMAGAAALVSAGAASAATVYNLDTYATDSGYTGSLGTVTVSGQGTNVLTFDVALKSNVFFQMQGNANYKDAFWFDLLNSGSSYTGGATFNVTTPNGPASGTGDFGTGGKFQGVRDLDDVGQGWSSNYDYGVQVRDNSGSTDYYTGDLIFTVTGDAGTHLDLASRTYNTPTVKGTVFGGADLRQCPGTDPTPSRGSCTTGPVGFSLAQQTSAVPEPATWAIMLMGFGGLGAMLRQRRQQVALVRA